MCTAAIAIGATVLGTVVQAAGAIQQGNAAARAAEYNAQVSQLMAADAIKRGEAEEEKSRRAQGKLMGRQIAVMSARGLDISTGSPLAILGDTAVLGQLEAETVRADAKREAVGYQNQAVLQRMEGRSAKTAGYIDAFGTVLGGIGQVAESWYNLKLRRGRTGGGQGGY